MPSETRRGHGKALSRFLERLPLPSVAKMVLLGMGVASVLEVGGLGIRFILQIVLARQLGPTGYGTYSFNHSWIVLLAIPASLGLSSSVMRFIPTYMVNDQTGHLAGFVRRVYQTLIVSTSLVTLFAILVSALFSSDDLSLLYWWTFLLIPFSSVVLVQAEMIRAASGIVRARIFTSVIQPASLTLFVLTVAGVTGRVTPANALVGLACTLLVGTFLQGTLLFRSLASSIRQVTPRFETRLWIRVSLALLLVKGMQLVLNQTDIILVGLLLGPREAGLYAAATRTAVLTNLVLSVTNLAIAPDLVRSFARKDLHRMESLLRTGSKFTFVPTLFVVVLMLLFGRQILNMFGTGFSESYGILVALTVGRLINAATGPVGTLLNLTGKERLTAVVYGSAAVLNLGLSLLLIPALGAVGAAFATSLTMALWNIALCTIVWREHRILPWPLPRLRSHQ